MNNFPANIVNFVKSRMGRSEKLLTYIWVSIISVVYFILFLVSFAVNLQSGDYWRAVASVPVAILLSILYVSCVREYYRLKNSLSRNSEREEGEEGDSNDKTT